MQKTKYTGRSIGTKKSWSQEGLDRFNDLVVKVYKDRELLGKDFDERFLKWTKHTLNTVNKEKGNLKSEDTDEKKPAISAVVYNDFNMETMLSNIKAGFHKETELEQEGDKPDVEDDDGDGGSKKIVEL